MEKKEFNAKLKDVRSIIKMEVERILNTAEKHGFKVNDRENSLLYLGIIIESLSNKMATMLIMDKELEGGLMNGKEFSRLMVGSIEAHIMILHAVNWTAPKKDFNKNFGVFLEYKKIEAYLAAEIAELAMKAGGI